MWATDLPMGSLTYDPTAAVDDYGTDPGIRMGVKLARNLNRTLHMFCHAIAPLRPASARKSDALLLPSGLSPSAPESHRINP
jgi:hypothetical protein